MATPTGLEPAASAVTGRRANQLRYGASCAVLVERVLRRAGPGVGRGKGYPMHHHDSESSRTPNGIRTRATAVKGRGPGPLDDGGNSLGVTVGPGPSEDRASIGVHPTTDNIPVTQHNDGVTRR
jgi:integrase